MMFPTFAPLNFILKYKFCNNMRAILKILIVLSVYPIVFSCRQVPLEENVENGNISLGKPVSVEINFLGVEYENAKNVQVLESNESSSKIPQGINSFLFAEIKEIIPSNLSGNNEYFSSLDLESSIPAGNLPKGAKYSILAYKKPKYSNDEYAFHKRYDFTIGEENARMELTGGQNYTLIVISTGTQAIPNIVNVENFNGVYFRTKNQDPNIKFLYQKIENFIPFDSGDVRNSIYKIKRFC